MRDLTDEELEKYELLQCPSCKSKRTNVRRAKHDEYIVGCQDCFCKRICDGANLDYTVERWNEYARRCLKNEKKTE